MDFLHICCHTKSSKPPILFLHGWGGSKDSFSFVQNGICDRDLWFVSFAGHGKSKEPNCAMQIEDFANEVVEFIKQNNIVGCDIVAHSFGGRVALVLLAQHKQLLGRVVLTGCAGLKPKRKFCVKCKIFWFKLKKWCVFAKILPHKVLENCGSTDYKTLSEVMRQTFKNVVNKNLASYAKKINHEVLLIWGENDTETPLWMGKKLNKLIKQSSIIVLEGGTHFCFYEHPLQFVLILKNYFV